MKQPRVVILLRHAQSEDNRLREGSLYFQNEENRNKAIRNPDYTVNLSPRGQEQAIATGKYLKEIMPKSFDVIFHSGYERSGQTAHIINDMQKHPSRMICNIVLRECDPGYCYHMTESEVKNYFPYLWSHWKAMGSFFARPPGGESMADASLRLIPFVHKLLNDYPNKQILIVTHGRLIKCLRYLIEHLSYDEISNLQGGSPKNCSITTYEYSTAKGCLELKEYNKIVY